jgi:type IV pilus assembly protein PilV
MKQKKPQQGASLIEVLVSILIVCLGLLGMASMVAASVQYVKLAQFQTIGTQLAEAYAENLRANTSGFHAGNYDRSVVYDGASKTLKIPTCVKNLLCTPSEIANIDQAVWLNDLRRRLPAGGAYVLRGNNNALAADIWVMWADPSLVFSNGDLSVFGTGGDQCPAAAIADLPNAVIVPHCLYFRVSI